MTNPTTLVGRVSPEKVYRFRRSERALHWALAGPTLACLFTGAALFFVYNRNPTVGGRELFAWVHVLGGLCLTLLPLLAIALHRDDLRTHLANIKAGWKWSRAEVRWLFLMPLASLKKGIKLPEEGKFNAAEKLNFMSSMLSSAVMVVTGLMLLVRPTMVGAWFAHLVVAAMVLPLVAGHIFMAVINPASRVGLSGMVTGWVSRSWAAHHYRRWYRQLISRHVAYHGAVVPLAAPRPESDEQRAAARLKWVITVATMALALVTAGSVAVWASHHHAPRARTTFGSEQEFAQCLKARGETTDVACEARAESLREDCLAACPADRAFVCGQLCADSFDTCVGSCRRSKAGELTWRSGSGGDARALVLVP